MTCKKCNTRVPSGQRHCPNCGGATALEPLAPSNGPMVLPDAELSTAKAEMSEDDVVDPGDSARALDPDVDPNLDGDTDPELAPDFDPVGLEVGDPDVLDLDETSGPVAPPPAPRLEATPAPFARPSPLSGSSPAALRRLLVEDPALLEPGLAVYSDAEGTPLGASYASGVGEIDLLAVDTTGRMVVVMISEQHDGEALVAEVLQRIGWVRKHVAGAGGRVRGIVLCEGSPAGLSYSAAAVSDTVQFKTWRVALQFDDLEI